MCLYVTHVIRGLQSQNLSGEGISSGSHNIFTTQGHGGPPRMRVQLNAGASSEHERRYTSSTHPFILTRWIWKEIMFGNFVSLKFPAYLSCRWGKTPKKPHPANLSRPGIELGSAAWQACILPRAPQRWTKVDNIIKIIFAGCIVANGCETSSLTSEGEQRLSVLENKVLRKIFGTKRDEITG